MLLWDYCREGDGCVLDLVRPPCTPPPPVIVNDYDPFM
jgi:hypothetical protein